MDYLSTSWRMSSERPRPEYFAERSLGKVTAHTLRELGWTVHMIHEHYPNDAENVPDDEWIAYGCRHGWVGLTKDKRIRYRADELGALDSGHLFCLANGNLLIAEAVDRFVRAEPAMVRGTRRDLIGFYFVYEGGRIARKWP